MDLGLTGRVALVTGASKGIGRAIAAELVAEGARVAVASRSEERSRATAAEIGAVGFAHDTADVDGAPGLVARVADELGPIDVLVTNSGGPPPGPDPLAFSRAEWEDAYRMLVLGPLALIEAVMPGMRSRGFGRVVGVSSTAVREPIPVLMLSNAHRSGLLVAFKTIARDVAADGVTLNTLLTGRIATDRLAGHHRSPHAAGAGGANAAPPARLGTVQEMAAAPAFLCSSRASYITGEAIRVDGGMTRSV